MLRAVPVQGRKAAMLTAEPGRIARNRELRAFLETALGKLLGGGL